MDISVIIPVFNSSTIESCINSLLNQDFEGTYEIIIVDDGSPDEDLKFFKKLVNLIRTGNPRVLVIAQQHGGPAKARNLGVRFSKGKDLIFTDSDCVADKSLLTSLTEKLHSREDVAAVWGKYENLNERNLISRFVQCWMDYQYQNLKDKVNVFASHCVAIRKDVFNSVGGFDCSFKDANAEDNDLAYRITSRGFKILFSRNSIVYHPHPTSLFKLLRQQFWRAVWRVKLYRKHGSKHLGDTYIQKRTLFVPIIMGPLFALLFSLFILNLITLPSFLVSLFAFFFLVNLNFNRYTERHYKFKFSFLCFLLRSLVIVSWLFGGVYGMFKFLRD